MLSLSLLFLTAVAFASAELGTQTINVIIVVDTGNLFFDYENSPPSQDYQNPTVLSPGNATNYAFMVTTKDRAIDGQATANLTLRAKVTEPIRFSGMSESANMDAAIIVYNITKWTGTDVTTKAVFKVMRKGTVQPKEYQDFPEVDMDVDHDFWPIEANIKRKGTSVYKVQFGMYHRGRKNNEQKLFGYYEFLATLNVSY